MPECPERVAERAVRAALRLNREGRTRLALDYLLDAMETYPDCREALVLAADFYSCNWDDLGLEEAAGYPIAIELYDRAIAVAPDHVEAYAEKASTLIDLGVFQGDDTLGVPYWTKALQAASAALDCLNSRASADLPTVVWVNIAETVYRSHARALRLLGRRDEAEASLQDGLRRLPASSYLAATAAEWRKEEGNLAAALVRYEEALTLRRVRGEGGAGQALICQDLGRLHRQLGALGEARRYLREAEELVLGETYRVPDERLLAEIRAELAELGA